MNGAVGTYAVSGCGHSGSSRLFNDCTPDYPQFTGITPARRPPVPQPAHACHRRCGETGSRSRPTTQMGENARENTEMEPVPRAAASVSGSNAVTTGGAGARPLPCRCGRTLPVLVATRNDERSDAQSRADFDAQSVRTSVTMGAGYLGSWPLSMIRLRGVVSRQRPGTTGCPRDRSTG
jgi:hypothetical protein